MEPIQKYKDEAGATDTALPINGWPGFSITRDGRVFGPDGEKAQSTMKQYGYKYVSFWKDGKAYKELVHRLVAAHFIGEIPKGMHVCHGPGGKTDNRVENLRIDTPKGNAADKLRDGTQARGSELWNARLTDEDVEYIRRCKGMYRGVQRDLAEVFDVGEPIISNIMNNRTYSF